MARSEVAEEEESVSTQESDLVVVILLEEEVKVAAKQMKAAAVEVEAVAPVVEGRPERLLVPPVPRAPVRFSRRLTPTRRRPIQAAIDTLQLR